MFDLIMEEKHWLSIEKLVHLIEKSLAPDSIVEHNKMMIDLTSTKNKKRQCDIVITTGITSRKTMTIIEVQNRKSRFNINQFQGLIQKMRDVGAQHLICVSTSGFSKTIVEKVQQLGETVRLVTLNKYEPETFPIKLPKLIVNHTMSRIQTEEYPIINYDAGFDISIRLDEMIFEISNVEKKFNYIQLAEYYVSYILKPQVSGNYIVKFPSENHSLNLHYQEHTFNVSYFTWEIDVVVENYNIPVYTYSYEQLGNGALAWVLESYSNINGVSRLVRVPLTQNEDGSFKAQFIISE
jgi:hypothetical protein